MPEPIRVVRVIARLNMGGPALHVAYLTAGLQRRGYRTTLVAGSVGRHEESMEFVARELGVDVLKVHELHRDISPLRDLLAVVRLSKLIRLERPHIIHTHTAKAGAIGRLAALLAGRARPPIVVHTFHGHVLRGYFGRVRRRMFLSVERALARSTDALVAVSPEVRDELVAMHIAPAEKFHVIRLGIELERRVGKDDARTETRRMLGVPSARFVVGWIGRMTPVKRTDDVLVAFKLLVERGVDAALCMVGDGPERDTVERRAHELGIMRRCLFVGYQEDVAPYYAAFDALVLPSANEGTPVSAIEALAAGRPVVATRVGGVPDVIREGEDGYLVEVGDVAALAERLESLARDDALRERMGQAGTARVIPQYAVERLLADVDGFYRELLAKKGIAIPAAAP